jgi:hypothetical protein
MRLKCLIWMPYMDALYGCLYPWFLQVMANLLSNAIKHSTAGDTVSVSLAWTPTQVRVKVRDRGPGIDPQFRSRIRCMWLVVPGLSLPGGRQVHDETGQCHYWPIRSKRYEERK